MCLRPCGLRLTAILCSCLCRMMPCEFVVISFFAFRQFHAPSSFLILWHRNKQLLNVDDSWIYRIHDDNVVYILYLYADSRDSGVCMRFYIRSSEAGFDSPEATNCAWNWLENLRMRIRMELAFPNTMTFRTLMMALIGQIYIVSLINCVKCFCCCAFFCLRTRPIPAVNKLFCAAPSMSRSKVSSNEAPPAAAQFLHCMPTQDLKGHHGSLDIRPVSYRISTDGDFRATCSFRCSRKRDQHCWTRAATSRTNGLRDWHVCVNASLAWSCAW